MSDRSGYTKVGGGHSGPYPTLIDIIDKAGLELNGVLTDKRLAPWDSETMVYTVELLVDGTYKYWDKDAKAMQSKEFKKGESVQFRGTGSINYALKDTPLGAKIIIEYHGKIQHPSDPKKTLHDFDVWVDERAALGNETTPSKPSEPESDDSEDEEDKDLPF